jgi:hypothetical protein
MLPCPPWPRAAGHTWGAGDGGEGQRGARGAEQTHAAPGCRGAGGRASGALSVSPEPSRVAPPEAAALTSASRAPREDGFHRMPPFLEPAVPAAEEHDGGDGAQQQQQEEEGALDAVGSQQHEESRGDHGAGQAGGARRAAGGGRGQGRGRGRRSSARGARGARARPGEARRARLSASCPALAAPRRVQWLRSPRRPARRGSQSCGERGP